MKDQIQSLVTTALQALVADGVIPADHGVEPVIERTRDRNHGDFATNAAMALARPARRKPRELAEALLAALPPSNAIAKVEIAGPGFINFTLSADAYHRELLDILTRAARYGHSDAGQGRKVQIEFVSANPTGPLHVGHGRGAAIGDALARLMSATGWAVSREFYYNDAGVQIANLALSVQARARGLRPDDADWPADGYRGDYIADVANAFMAGETVIADDKAEVGNADPDDLDAVRRFAVAYLRREQDMDLQAFDVAFDVYFLESSLYDEGKVAETVERLAANGHAYEKDGALWLATTRFGDDKDRVMRKSDGSYTYFLPDVAYHLNKWQRGFTRVIDEQGADHHSTVTRVRAGLQALEVGIPEGWPEYVLHQMVTVMRGGEEVKISKRAGSYVTLRDLIDEVGKDATRFFLTSRKPDSQLVFDIDLARSQTKDNPVYYIQYAHARVCSIFKRLGDLGLTHDPARGRESLARLDASVENDLMAELSRFPEMVEAAARNAEPHLIAQYLRDVAYRLQTYYDSGLKVLVDDDADLRDARLTLLTATRQVLANGLWLLGVSAPEAM